MNQKRVLIVFLAALLLLAGCDGSMDEPQSSGLPGVNHPGSDIPVIDVPAGEDTGTPGSIHDLNEKYNEKNAAAYYGVYITNEKFSIQNIKPEYMVAYEAEYNEINDSYYENLWALDDQREAGTITVEKYYEELYRLQNDRDTAQFELQEKWESLNVWSPCLVNARIINNSNSNRTFQYVICYNNSWSDDGICYMSEPVTLTANSNAIYSFKINTGGKYLNSFFQGCYVY